jgi:hypothetical protein
MAARENQGLQAFVIFSWIVTLAVIITLVLVNNARKTHLARADQVTQQNSELNTQTVQAKAEASELKMMAGFGENDALATVREAFKAEMDRLSIPDTPEARQYNAVLRGLADEVGKLNVNVKAATDDAKQLKDSLDAVQAQADQQIAQFKEQMEAARTDLAEQQQKFSADYSRIEGEKTAIADQMTEQNKAHEAALAELKAQNDQLTTQIDTLDRSIDRLREGVPNPDQFAQPADGVISWVDQRNHTAFVNLGSADGLRPQVTFSVAEAGIADAAAAEKKGSIEITEIIGPHLAEARITDDSATNPLLVGDRIFSQVWDRGRTVGFGIAGFVDLDGDGNSDLEQLKNIIAASGGVVDAAPDDAGVKQGELKVSTRYLILGDYPNDARLGTRLGPLRESWAALSEEQERLGIDTIAVDEFLALIGWQRQARSVNMSRGSRAEDFPPEARTQEMPRTTGRPAGVFIKRLPNLTY